MIAVVPSPGVRVTVAESQSRDLVKVSEWCDIWGMKLNANKTKTMIVSRSRTMHPQSPALTIGGTVLKESDDLVSTLKLPIQSTHRNACVTKLRAASSEYSYRNASRNSELRVQSHDTFDFKMTFEKHLRSVPRAAFQRLGILRKSWQVFHDRLLLGRCFRGFVLPVLEYCSVVCCSAVCTH